MALLRTLYWTNVLCSALNFSCFLVFGYKFSLIVALLNTYAAYVLQRDMAEEKMRE